jgi:hypothetical protein
LPFEGWLRKITKKPNILMLLKLANGFLIGGFSEDAFYAAYPKDRTKNNSVLMSLTNMKKFPLK